MANLPAADLAALNADFAAAGAPAGQDGNSEPSTCVVASKTEHVFAIGSACHEANLPELRLSCSLQFITVDSAHARQQAQSCRCGDASPAGVVQLHHG
jgi:hypothetical protein